MHPLWGVLLIAVGTVMIVSPKLFYAVTESWKSDPGAEPSHLFALSTRIGGVLFFLAGVGVFTVRFLE